MSDIPDITLEEAQMRFIRMLKERGYPTAPKWALHSNTGIYSSHFVGGLEGVRALMWREKKKWAASVSMQVGERGEWILAGGLIGRQRKQSWKLPSLTKLVGDMVEMREVLPRWGMEKDRYLNVIALATFARDLLKTPNCRRQAERVLIGIKSGVVSEATTTEALSIVQYLYCRTRLERVMTNIIWKEIFR